MATTADSDVTVPVMASRSPGTRVTGRPSPPLASTDTGRCAVVTAWKPSPTGPSPSRLTRRTGSRGRRPGSSRRAVPVRDTAVRSRAMVPMAPVPLATLALGRAPSTTLALGFGVATRRLGRRVGDRACRWRRWAGRRRRRWRWGGRASDRRRGRGGSGGRCRGHGRARDGCGTRSGRRGGRGHHRGRRCRRRRRAGGARPAHRCRRRSRPPTPRCTGWARRARHPRRRPSAIGMSSQPAMRRSRPVIGATSSAQAGQSPRGVGVELGLAAPVADRQRQQHGPAVVGGQLESGGRRAGTPAAGWPALAPAAWRSPRC